MVIANVILKIETLMKKGDYIAAWLFIKMLPSDMQTSVIDEILCSELLDAD